GYFELTLPQWLYRFTPKPDKPGGAFLFGVFTALLGLPCFGFFFFEGEDFTHGGVMFQRRFPKAFLNAVIVRFFLRPGPGINNGASKGFTSPGYRCIHGPNGHKIVD
ncbi:MAG: hypothetical protein AAFY83_08240, partial [Pseudomonadota bacterium]